MGLTLSSVFYAFISSCWDAWVCRSRLMFFGEEVRRRGYSNCPFSLYKCYYNVYANLLILLLLLFSSLNINFLYS